MIEEIINFWFGEPGSEGYGAPRSFWFKSTPEIDQEIRSAFEEVYSQAINGKKYDDELALPNESLAIILLFDQIPRNMFRGTARAFATDSRALEIAKNAIAKGHDKHFPPFQRKFFYLPFMHSENLSDQDRCIELYRAMGDEDGLDYAQKHRDIIARFGRFPHRNKTLNRESTHEEIEFLKQENSSF